jgi:trans-2-enoyl-CoA reductase
MPKAVQYSAHGHPPDIVDLVDLATGAPQEDEVVVEMEAVAISLGNLYEIMGLPGFKGPVPTIAGNKCVGRIVDIGGAVTGFQVGQRVHVTLHRAGTWREQVRVPISVVYPAPEEADPAQLSLVSGGVLTSYFALKDFVDLKSGDWVIQNAANSNCGRNLISLARLWGYKTANVVRRELAFADLEKLGADAIILDGPDLATRVAEATGGAQIRLGLDAVAGEATERIAECLADGGTVACYGLASRDRDCKISVGSLLFRDIRLVGHYIARSRSDHTREQLNAVYAEMGKLVVNGTLTAQIAGVYPLARIREALSHALKEGEERKGKVILVP